MERWAVPTLRDFLLPKDGTDYEFLSGRYEVLVYVSLVCRPKQFLLGAYRLSLNEDQAHAIANRKSGVYFDWGPDLSDYQSHVDPRRTLHDVTVFLDSIEERGRSEADSDET
jgi:hypothetical protein